MRKFHTQVTVTFQDEAKPPMIFSFSTRHEASLFVGTAIKEAGVAATHRSDNYPTYDTCNEAMETLKSNLKWEV